MSEAQERDEIIGAVREFLQTAPKVECMALGTLVEMVSDSDEYYRLLKEATANGVCKPSDVIDYIIEHSAA